MTISSSNNNSNPPRPRRFTGGRDLTPQQSGASSPPTRVKSGTSLRRLLARRPLETGQHAYAEQHLTKRRSTIDTTVDPELARALEESVSVTGTPPLSEILDMPIISSKADLLPGDLPFYEADLSDPIHRAVKRKQEEMKNKNPSETGNGDESMIHVVVWVKDPKDPAVPGGDGEVVEAHFARKRHFVPGLPGRPKESSVQITVLRPGTWYVYRSVDEHLRTLAAAEAMLIARDQKISYGVTKGLKLRLTNPKAEITDKNQSKIPSYDNLERDPNWTTGICSEVTTMAYQASILNILFGPQPTEEGETQAKKKRPDYSVLKGTAFNTVPSQTMPVTLHHGVVNDPNWFLVGKLVIKPEDLPESYQKQS